MKRFVMVERLNSSYEQNPGPVFGVEDRSTKMGFCHTVAHSLRIRMQNIFIACFTCRSQEFWQKVEKNHCFHFMYGVRYLPGSLNVRLPY